MKLKPCPFCGYSAEIVPDVFPWAPGLPVFYVQCENCGSSSDYEHSEESAAELWNDRVKND